MPVFEGSRYSGSKFTAIPGTDGVTRKWVHTRKPLTAKDIKQDWVVHVVQEGEALDDLAYKYSGPNANKHRLWYLIAEANNLIWPMDLEPGREIIIPVADLRERN